MHPLRRQDGVPGEATRQLWIEGVIGTSAGHPLGGPFAALSAAPQTRMSDGTPTPGWHEGMAAFRHGDLVSSSATTNGAPFAPAGATYDPAAGGGTTARSLA